MLPFRYRTRIIVFFTGLTPCARCLTIQSSALPLPKYNSRTRNSSSISLLNRTRMGSECDLCFDKVEPKIRSSHTTILFPPLMQKSLFTFFLYIFNYILIIALDEAAAAENWLINYLWKFRLVRYSWRFMIPAVMPMQYTLFGLRR